MLKPLVKLAGKGDFELDSVKPMDYIVLTSWNYETALVRGLLRRSGFESRAGRCFIGRRVTLRCKRKIRLGSNARLRDGVYIDTLSHEGVVLGDRVSLGTNTRFGCTGSLFPICKGLTIVSNSTFGASCYFGATSGIDIGCNVIAGQLVRFHSENHNFADTSAPICKQGVTRRGIRIDDNVWIGAGAVFPDGAQVRGGALWLLMLRPQQATTRRIPLLRASRQGLSRCADCMPPLVTAERRATVSL